jgi:hypothetical protein
MLLSARMLNGVADVNHFEAVQTLEFTQGDAPDIYFVLVDASADKALNPAGRRFVAGAGATLQVTLQDIDSSVTLVKYATQPFPEDKSIWKFSFDPVTDSAAMAGLVGTYALKLKLTEPGPVLPAAWAIGTTYAVDTLVSYLGGLWRSLQNANVGNQPDTSPLWWVRMNTVTTKVTSGFVGQAINIARTVQEF